MSKDELLTLTRLTKFLNKNYTKKTGSKFTTGDVQGYIFRKRLPGYMGGKTIKEDKTIPGVTLYKLV